MRKIDSLQYQIQQVLPTVYDDSLSFYELVNKVVQKLNEVIAQSNEYFSQDISVHVEKIITQWEESGKLHEIINQEIFTDLSNTLTQVQKEVEGVRGFRVLHVNPNSPFTTITQAIDHAKANGVSKNNRFLIKISQGVYTEQITLAHGIDIEGEHPKNTTIQWFGNNHRSGDTIKCAFDVSLRNLTIIQEPIGATTDVQNYPLHADDPNGDYHLLLENLEVYAKGEWGHHAVGLGLYGGQNVTMKNVSLHSESKSAFYLHNWLNQQQPITCEIESSRIFGCILRDKTNGKKSAILLEDVGSTQYDEVKIKNTELYSYGGQDVQLLKHSGYSGVRNTLCVSLQGCRYQTYSYEDDSGRIIDMSQGVIVGNLPSGTDGNPLITTDNTQMGQVLNLKVSDVNNATNFIGNAIGYGGVVFCQKEGVSNGVVFGPVAKGGLLTTRSDGAYVSGTVGNGNCVAIALEPITAAEYKKIKILLISPR